MVHMAEPPQSGVVQVFCETKRDVNELQTRQPRHLPFGQGRAVFWVLE